MCEIVYIYSALNYFFTNIQMYIHVINYFKFNKQFDLILVHTLVFISSMPSISNIKNSVGMGLVGTIVFIQVSYSCNMPVSCLFGRLTKERKVVPNLLDFAYCFQVLHKFILSKHHSPFPYWRRYSSNHQPLPFYIVFEQPLNQIFLESENFDCIDMNLQFR